MKKYIKSKKMPVRAGYNASRFVDFDEMAFETGDPNVYVCVRMADYDEPVAFIYGDGIQTRYGNIMAYQHIGQHGEASMGFAQSCKAPRGDEVELADELFDEILSIYNDVNVVRKQRINWDIVRRNWV